MMKALIDELAANRSLSNEKWVSLTGAFSAADAAYAAGLAREITDSVFGRRVYFRGIIEFTNHCRNDCFYCGLRRSAGDTARYRLTEEEILASAREGHALGYRTFVLQGGEDPYFTDDRLCRIVSGIRALFPDSAVTLSVGERSRESYRRLLAAGASRYLLRHETAVKSHYEKLHPPEMSFDNRMRCLRDLKELGYQTGCGMMVGSPFQTAEDLAQDMLFLCAFRPEMIGIGPFRPHHGTPFRDFPDGSAELSVFLMSLCRIMAPQVLLPATTALDCGGGDGRVKALLAGANVIMPNLSPTAIRKKYLLYDGKPGLEQDPEDSLATLRAQVEAAGFEMVIGRGDYGAAGEEKRCGT